MPRHVLHVEGRGFPTPRRVRRQRQILNALSKRYRALPRSAGGAPRSHLRQIRSYGFSLRMTPEDAVARIVELLDETDPEWREFVEVWDGFNGGIRHAVRG